MTRVLLISGGVESTCLAVACRPDIGITIDYGQVSAEGEIEAAKQICAYLSIQHRVLVAKASFAQIGLLAGAQPVDLKHPEFWPFRNQYLVTCAAIALYNEPVEELMIGTVAGDAKFADGTSAFITQMNCLLRLQGFKAKLVAPAIGLTTAELLIHAKLPPQLAGITFSCHASSVACGGCPGCLKNEVALAEFYDPRQKASP